MKFQKIKFTVLILGVSLLLSCNMKKDENSFNEENYDVKLANVFSVYGDHFDEDSLFLNEMMNNKKVKLAPNEQYDKLNDLLGSYGQHLDSIDLISQKSMKNLFYEQGIKTKEAENFIIKTENFLKKFNEVCSDEILKNYANHYFSLEDIKNQDGYDLNYFDYYYLGAPYPVFKFLVKKRKYELLVLQNELLNSYLHR